MKYLFMLSLVGLLVHHGVIDAWLWEKGEKYSVPKFFKSDLFYLGGNALLILAITISGSLYQTSVTIHILTAISAIIIGDIGWDWVFGILLYRDPLYPYPNWYGGWGFKNRTQRIIFDIMRFILAIILFLLTI